MVFVFAGTVLRYVFNAPILGNNEVLEMAAVALVMLAIPYCTLEDAHVRIDLLDKVLGDIGRWLTEILYRGLAAWVLFYLVRSYVYRTLDALEYSDVTNLLRIPIWPFCGLVALGMGLYALILSVQLLFIVIRIGKRT